MPRRVVVSHVGQLVANDQHNHFHHAPQPAPPDDPCVSQECPQCSLLTWRYTRHCLHCRLDLQAWRARQRLRAPLRWLRALAGRWRLRRR